MQPRNGRGRVGLMLPEAPASLMENIDSRSLTTLQVGGSARWLVQLQDLNDLEEALTWAKKMGTPTLFLGSGSNLLFSDDGFPGLILKNQLLGREADGPEVEIWGGENLSETISWLNTLGLSGMEQMFGIPGTMAGAVVGNAGAYGQEISDNLTEADVWVGGKIKTFPKQALGFRYRHSVFKEQRDWFLLKCRFRLSRTERNLTEISNGILKQREKKYPPELRCPGSFFKNIEFQDLNSEVQRKIPASFVLFDKIPAGKLLESVGANAARRGDAAFADYHGNLIINWGKATSEDMLGLAFEFADRVKRRYGIRLEPEILIVESHGRLATATND